MLVSGGEGEVRVALASKPHGQETLACAQEPLPRHDGLADVTDQRRPTCQGAIVSELEPLPLAIAGLGRSDEHADDHEHRTREPHDADQPIPPVSSHRPWPPSGGSSP